MKRDPEEWRQVTAGDIVTALLTRAIEEKASDIHVEPLDTVMRIRFRRDGVLTTAAMLPGDKGEKITARLKILAGLDIANKRIPQDGRIIWQEKTQTIDMRVSTMPTIRGEKTVIRLLDTGQLELELSCLGMLPEVQAVLRQLIHRSHGLFIFSGPTGSGKTSTLYAALQELHLPEVSIATLEDPVEYKVEGICQSQIQTKGGLLFQNGLRALLRQDPDILVIGEIRDRETARIAVQAALTGHVVFTTLHTATAVEVPERLIDMGVEPYLVADALVGMTAQRLVRRLCPHCRKKREDSQIRGLYRHHRCERCFFSGYKGRFSLCEIVRVGETVRHCIRQGGMVAAMREAAIADGAIFMETVIRTQLQSGNTDWEEIQRVCDGSEGNGYGSGNDSDTSRS